MYVEKYSGFNCVIFRRNFNQIFNPGGLSDESKNIYGLSEYKAQYKSGYGDWVFPNGAKIVFRHIDRDESLSKWQGSQICEICFDELTHFTEKQFFYMMSRNRSMCGVTPHIRATCNPDSDSWVANFIEWWIDPDTGYPIPERSGKKRWFVRQTEGEIVWANTKNELIETLDLKTDEEKQEPKSVAFVPSSIYDNQKLLKANPSYLSSLKALPLIERERLLNGNWKIKPASGMYFKRNQVEDMLNFIPADVTNWVRCWDLASTTADENKDSARTAGVLMGKRANGKYVVADVINVQLSANDVRQLIKHTAQQDIARFKRVRVRIPQDPGQAGKDQAQSYIKFLAGFNVTAALESGSKESRAEPMSAQWQAGNFDVLIADWNEIFFSQLESFPQSKFKDMVDAAANAFIELELKNVFNINNLVS
jgi:predicted phage terminase large subunit-like protein